MGGEGEIPLVWHIATIDAALLAYHGNVDTDRIIEFSNGCEFTMFALYF